MEPRSKGLAPAQCGSWQGATATLLAAMAIGLVACGSTPTTPPPADSAPELVEVLPEPQPRAQVLAPLNLRPDLRAAARLVDAGDWAGAARSFATMDTGALSADEQHFLQLQGARATFLRGATAEASQLLLGLTGTAGLHPELQRATALARLEFAILQDAHLEAAALADGLLSTGLLPDAESVAVTDALWLALHRTEDGALRTALSAARGSWRGWLELAAISRDTTISALQRAERLERWLGGNPGHVAATSPPEALLTLTDLPPAARSIALLLPLTGPLSTAAAAARDGFLAAFLADAGDRDRRADVLIFDTFEDGLETAWIEALNAGADYVVGPLDRNFLVELAGWRERPLPVIALNRLEDTDDINPDGLTQLSLAPDDEAQQLARLAFAAGHRRALILHSDGIWADKLRLALQAQWQALGGQTVDTAPLGGRSEVSAALEGALQIGNSEARAQELRRLLGTELAFTPRRRQDIDVVFLLAADPAEARSVRPLLDFHYASDVPLFATSHAYAGQRNAAQDRDLEGVTVLALPLLLADAEPLRESASESERRDTGLLSLRALGADAYALLALPADRPVLLRGHTGLLQREINGKVLRESRPAVFTRGALKGLN